MATKTATKFDALKGVKMSISTDSGLQKAIRQAIQDNKEISYPIAGTKGLLVRIRPKNGKATVDFRHRYTHPITGKRPYMSLGQYPSFSLAQAKQAYNDNLALLEQGIDPLENRHAQKQNEIIKRANTLDHFIDEWRAIQQAKNLAPDTYRKQNDNTARIQKSLGHLQVTDISPATVIEFINDIQKTHIYKGIEVKGVLKSILQIAVSKRIINQNPASDLTGTYKPHKTKHKPAITEPYAFSKLLNDIDNVADTFDYNRQILQLLAMLFVRIGDLCAMKWEQVDLANGLWEFRPQKAGRRKDMLDIVVPLPRQAILILKQMHSLTGHTPYVFYTGRQRTPYTDHQRINNALNSPTMNNDENDGAGYKGIHCPHGFRASAKTILMERLGYGELITELQLGHTMLNRYGRAYSRMEMLQERSEMIQAWADYLDNLRAGDIGTVIHFKPKQGIIPNAKAVNE